MAQYSIKDLEKLSGIKAHTIRIWEKRYGLLHPDRTETNIRYYCDEDLRKLLNVASLVKNGQKISKIAVLCKESVRNEILKMKDQDADPDRRVDQLVRLMMDLDTREFELVLSKIFSEMGAEKAVINVFFPFLERIGILWQIGSIVPAHEHFVSSLIRNKLISETEKLPVPISAKAILLFLKEDELHELSLLFFNLLARQNGVRTIYLGANVPLHDLTEIAGKYEFNLVATAFVNAISKDELEKYLHHISELFSNKTILVSGLQIKLHQPEIPSNLALIDTPEGFISAINIVV